MLFRSRTEIVADRVQFGPRAFGGGAGAGSKKDDGHVPPDDASPGGTGIEYPKDDINPEDIPF